MDAIEYFRVGVALLYHEARHVRRLTSLTEPASWGTLRALPGDRSHAWHQLRPFYLQSAKASTARAVETLFVAYFRKDLADLEELFRDQVWPTNFGGAKWAEAAASVRALGSAIDSGDAGRTQEALAAVRTAQHNTGTLMDKYRRLESK